MLKAENCSVEPPVNLARNDIVDAYRAILIYAVLCFHYLIRWTPPRDPANTAHLDHLYPRYLEIGAYGVQVFFVISGLVITMTVLRSHDALDFGFRRASRLYPAAIVCSALTFVAMLVLGPPPFQHGIKDLFATMTLVAPFLKATNVDGAYWSLTEELKFYGLVGVSYLIWRDKFWVAITGFAFTIGVAQLLDFHPNLVNGVFLGNFISFFCFGMALWYALFERRSTPAAWLSLAALVNLPEALSILDIAQLPSLPAQAAVLVTIASLAALLAANVRLPLGPLPYLGRISYSLYLLHQNIGVTIIALLKRTTHCPDLVAFLAAATAATGLAALVFHTIEKPAQEWLRGHYLTRRPQLAAAQRFVANVES